MRVVRAKECDVKDICVCYTKSLENVNKTCYGDKAIKFLVESFTEKEFSKMVEGGNVYCLKKSDHVAGFVFVNENKIDGLYVHPIFSGKGYGKKLIRFAEKKIKCAGYMYSRVYSTLNSENFYVSNGYSSFDIVVAEATELLQFILMKKKISN
jgi:GNAT superfamily N-acetyltransferase